MGCRVDTYLFMFSSLIVLRVTFTALYVIVSTFVKFCGIVQALYYLETEYCLDDVCHISLLVEVIRTKDGNNVQIQLKCGFMGEKNKIILSFYIARIASKSLLKCFQTWRLLSRL